MSDQARRALAGQQRRLLDALAGGAVPPGFDGSQLELTARTLRNKRARSLARRWPELCGMAEFDEQFDAYFRQNPAAADGGTDLDGEKFYRFLQGIVPLSDAVTIEWLRHRARRKWIAVGRLGQRDRFAIAIRLPWTAGRVWVLAP
jgi:hypothetical protein